MTEEPKNIKIGIFGGGGVGKTCITLRYIKNEFTDGYIPTIEDEFSKVIEVEGQTVSLSVIDTAGQDDFKEMRYSYYSKVDGFIFVFDIGNPDSIDELDEMYEDADNAKDGTISCVVAANKADLRDEGRNDLVQKEKYAEIESKFHCKVIETSAKSGLNVENLFITVLKKLIEKPKAKAKQAEKSESKKSEEGGCCEIA